MSTENGTELLRALETLVIEAVDDQIAAKDFDSEIRTALEKMNLADYIDGDAITCALGKVNLTDKIDVDDLLADVDWSDKIDVGELVEDAVNNMDLSDYIDVDKLDLDDKVSDAVESAMDDVDWAEKVKDALGDIDMYYLRANLDERVANVDFDLEHRVNEAVTKAMAKVMDTIDARIEAVVGAVLTKLDRPKPVMEGDQKAKVAALLAELNALLG